jgi:hypothetical protein
MEMYAVSSSGLKVHVKVYTDVIQPYLLIVSWNLTEFCNY